MWALTDFESCTDCAALVANGTLGNNDEATDAAHAARIVEHVGPAIASRLAVADYEPEPFSIWPCQTCGAALAGERFTLAAAVLVGDEDTDADAECTCDECLYGI